MNIRTLGVALGAVLAIGPSVGMSHTATMTPTPISTHHPWGDTDCDDVLTSVDVIGILAYASGSTHTTDSNACIHPGMQTAAGLIGDTDCDGSITALDAFYVLSYVGGISHSHTNPDCPPIGAPVGGY